MRLSATASFVNVCPFQEITSGFKLPTAQPGSQKEFPMSRVRLLALLSVVLLAGSLSQAQTATGETLMLDLPRTSQHALVSQRIGITDITINYHRPLANGRQIWGKLAPYGQVWRAGANENTTITFTDPVQVEGQPLEKGTYGVHMIPGESEWTVIFSKNATAWGSFSYKQDEDALRVKESRRPRSCTMRWPMTLMM